MSKELNPKVPRLPKSIFLIFLALLLFAQSLTAQTDNFKPVPYGENEFPLFLQDLRRFEVILIGSIPITLLLSSLVYDIVYSISDPDIKTLANASSNEQILGKVGISISISALLAVIDIAIHLGKRSKERKEREKLQRKSEAASSP